MEVMNVEALEYYAGLTVDVALLQSEYRKGEKKETLEVIVAGLSKLLRLSELFFLNGELDYVSLNEINEEYEKYRLLQK